MKLDLKDAYGRPITQDDYQQRWGKLKTERANWESHWRELSTNILPRNGRFFAQDRNDGSKKHNSILDNTATRSLNILSAGMMAGASSPARPWFTIQTPNPDLNEYEPVRRWNYQVSELIRSIFSKSNTYRALHTSYNEIAVFGTHANIIMPNFDNVIHHHPMTIGEYCLASNNNGQVDTLYRRIEKTVGQLVQEFGIENCSKRVQDEYKNQNFDNEVTIVHCIEPRSHRDSSKLDAQNMEYASLYFEEGQETDQFLRISGFRDFRATCPRWQVIGGDDYGHSPGMELLGDIKQLQHEQKSKGLAIDYMVKPPLQVPTAMKNDKLARLPGGVSYYDANQPNAGIRTAFETNLDLNYLLADIQDVRERIRGGFHSDLFLMLTGADNTRMTATEVAERHEEKLLMLGPVMERLHNELLEPLVSITFNTALDAGILPAPPPELEGQDLNIEFVSMLAQAQKAILRLAK